MTTTSIVIEKLRALRALQARFQAEGLEDKAYEAGSTYARLRSEYLHGSLGVEFAPSDLEIKGQVETIRAEIAAMRAIRLAAEGL